MTAEALTLIFLAKTVVAGRNLEIRLPKQQSCMNVSFDQTLLEITTESTIYIQPCTRHPDIESRQESQQKSQQKSFIYL